MKNKPIANIFEAELKPWKKGNRFEAGLARLGAKIGAEQLGAQYHVVPAGKSAFPRHAHHNNEEMLIVMSGEGEYQAGDDIWPVKAGDIIAAPVGDGSTAHQMRNNSQGELKYLVVSTRNDPDVVEYPDSGKFAVASMIPKDTGMLGARIAYIGKKENSLDYWDGEDTNVGNTSVDDTDAKNTGEEK